MFTLFDFCGCNIVGSGVSLEGGKGLIENVRVISLVMVQLLMSLEANSWSE